jgi:hypothetical protein
MASESPWAASEVKNHCNLSSLVPLPPLSLSNRMPSIKEAVNSTCTPSQSASMRINLQGQWRWFQHKAVPEKDAACCQPSCLSPHLILELANQFVFENRNGTQHGLQFTSHCQPETVYATNALHEIAIWLHQFYQTFKTVAAIHQATESMQFTTDLMPWQYCLTRHKQCACLVLPKQWIVPVPPHSQICEYALPYLPLISLAPGISTLLGPWPMPPVSILSLGCTSHASPNKCHFLHVITRETGC